MDHRASCESAGTVALVVDSPGRDLTGIILLAAELARRKVNVQLVPMNLREREISALNPDLVVMNYVRKGNQDMIDRIQSSGFDVCLLDTEGGIGIIGAYGNIYDHYGNVLATNKQVRDRLGFVCAWGSQVAEAMIAKGWYRADQVVITGSPRFDWYDESLKAIALDATPVESAQPMVLIIGSFPAANPLFRSAEDEMAQRERNTGYDRSDIDELRARDIVAMEATIDLTERLARQYPNANFVFRPHPFELTQTYVERFADLDNVEVFGTGTAESWILRANAVVVPSDCTIGVESAMARVPALVTDWIVPENRVDAVLRAGHRFDQADDLVACVGQILDGSFAGKGPAELADTEQVISDWFHRADGQSHRRVADLICDHLTPGDRPRAARRRLHYMRAPGQTGTIGKVQDHVLRALRLPVRFSLRRLRVDHSMRWDTSPKAYSRASIQPTVDALNLHKVFGDQVITVRDADSARDYDYRYAGRTLVVQAHTATAPEWRTETTHGTVSQ